MINSPDFQSVPVVYGGVQREHVHPVSLRQKQPNQPVLAIFLKFNFFIRHPLATW